MENFKSQVIHVVESVEKLALPERIEALSYLQKITEACKKDSVCLNNSLDILSKYSFSIQNKNQVSNKNLKHKCKNRLCLIYNIRHLKIIMCVKCKKHVETDYQLFEHIQSHLDYPISCFYCHCVFRNSEDYNSHKIVDCKHVNTQKIQNVQKYICRVCHSSFINKKAFQSHLVDSHGMKLYNNWYGCKLCCEMFEQRKMLYHHYKQAHSELKCKLKMKKQQKEFSSYRIAENLELINSSLKKNQNTSLNDSSENEKFQCDHCSKMFLQKSMLRMHMKRCHLNEKEFICDLCKQVFTVYRNYKRHLKSASHRSKGEQDNYPLFKCEICSKIYSNHDSLSTHQVRVHFTKKKHKCPLCDFKTNLAVSFNRHVSLHTDNRKFICDKCGSCFHTLSALKEHTIYIHSNERNYSCEVCGQMFKLKSGLNRHYKTHSDVKEFKCFCGLVYKFRTNLNRHLQSTHKIVSKKNNVTRITTEEEGYALNSPKMVKKTIRSEKLNLINSTKIDDFDIPSLGPLSDVDLSCTDEVLRETYNDFSKYSTANNESQESFGSILPSVNLIDQVLQNNNSDSSLSLQESKQPLMNNRELSNLSKNELVNSIGNSLAALNYKSNCRQYLGSSVSEMPSSNNHYTLTATSTIDHPYINSLENGLVGKWSLFDL